MPQDLAVLAPLGLLIVKTQTMYSNYYVYLIINEMYIRTCQWHCILSLCMLYQQSCS